MPLAPAIEFHFDDTWPAGEPKVFLTPTWHWGPLISGLFYVLALNLLVGVILLG